MKSIKENKVLKFIWKKIYILIVLFLVLMITFVIVQKTTNNRGSIGGIKIFTVITGSMIPVYNIGDILIVKEVSPAEIKVNDDIVYEGEKGSFKGKTITHRVLEIQKKEDGNYGIITKGVANTARDPEINQTQVLGKVIGKIPIINYILKLIFNIYVWILIIVGIFIYKKIQKIRNMNHKRGGRI